MEGISVEIDAANRDETIGHALSYRGDVSVSTHQGDVTEGYAFDLQNHALRLDTSDGSSRVCIPVEQIACITFSGRDMAAGKSFDRWIRRYIDKKLSGEVAEIRSEDLESAP